MERNEMERINDAGRGEFQRRESQRATYDDGSSAALTAWKIVGGTALAVAAVAFIFALPDLKRYIKISRM